jgi:hypothetical protein
MEMLQGNQCIAILNKQKCHFFFYKNRDQEGRTGPAWGGGTSGKGEDVGRGCRRVNMVQIFVHVYVTWKMRPVETVPGMGEGDIMENDEGVNSTMICS